MNNRNQKRNVNGEGDHQTNYIALALLVLVSAFVILLTVTLPRQPENNRTNSEPASEQYPKVEQMDGVPDDLRAFVNTDTDFLRNEKRQYKNGKTERIITFEENTNLTQTVDEYRNNLATSEYEIVQSATGEDRLAGTTADSRVSISFESVPTGSGVFMSVIKSNMPSEPNSVDPANLQRPNPTAN